MRPIASGRAKRTLFELLHVVLDRVEPLSKPATLRQYVEEEKKERTNESFLRLRRPKAEESSLANLRQGQSALRERRTKNAPGVADWSFVVAERDAVDRKA